MVTFTTNYDVDDQREIMYLQLRVFLGLFSCDVMQRDRLYQEKGRWTASEVWDLCSLLWLTVLLGNEFLLRSGPLD